VCVCGRAILCDERLISVGMMALCLCLFRCMAFKQPVKHVSDFIPHFCRKSHLTDNDMQCLIFKH